MKKFIIPLTLLTVLLISCGQKESFILGTWEMDNLNSADSSANHTTLLSTFIPDNYSNHNLLEFSDSKTLTMKATDGTEIGSGNYKLTDQTIIISFPDDKIESAYTIMDKTDSTLRLTAYNDGEIINISLLKK
jgi:hypothetical protein